MTRIDSICLKKKVFCTNVTIFQISRVIKTRLENPAKNRVAPPHVFFLNLKPPNYSLDDFETTYLRYCRVVMESSIGNPCQF